MNDRERWREMKSMDMRLERGKRLSSARISEHRFTINVNKMKAKLGKNDAPRSKPRLADSQMCIFARFRVNWNRL